MSEERPDQTEKDEDAVPAYPVDPATEQETRERESARLKEEQKHHEQTGS